MVKKNNSFDKFKVNLKMQTIHFKLGFDGGDLSLRDSRAL